MNDDLWPDWDDIPEDEKIEELAGDSFVPADVVYPMQMNDNIFHYRLPGDDINTIRVNNSAPHKCIRVGKNIAVAGVSYRKEQVDNFVFGQEQSLSLKAEPTNQYDPNAIMVIGHWTKGSVKHEEHIGYIPKKMAAKLDASEIIVVLKTMFVPYKGKSAGVRMDLWKEDDMFKGEPDPMTLAKRVIQEDSNLLMLAQYLNNTFDEPF